MEEAVPSGSHAGVGVTQMALVPVVSQAHSSKPSMDRQSLCYLNGYTGRKNKVFNVISQVQHNPRPKSNRENTKKEK